MQLQVPRKKQHNYQTIADQISAQQIPESGNPIARAEKINIERLFEQVFKQYQKEEVSLKKIKQKELEHLSSIIEEYMSCYVLIGYTMQDEQAVIFNSGTPKDEAALADLLRAVFIDMMAKRP